MPGFDVVQRWKGRIAIARDGEPLGAIEEVLYDAAGDQPGWALLDAAAGWRLVPVVGDHRKPGKVISELRG